MAAIQRALISVSEKTGVVDFAKQFGNLLVAVETDTVRQDGEEVQMRRLSLYECEDGKLHRCWSFPIAEENV